MGSEHIAPSQNRGAYSWGALDLTDPNATDDQILAEVQTCMVVYVLSGFLVCGSCNAKLIIVSGGKRGAKHGWCPEKSPIQPVSSRGYLGGNSALTGRLHPGSTAEWAG